MTELARVLKPGGRALIVDMLPHEHLEYQQQMGHVWLGFSEAAMRKALTVAGFADVRWHPLPVDPDARGPAIFVATAIRKVQSS
jgi:ArsR family transcriptional regulator